MKVPFETAPLPIARTSVAPDGSDVRVLLQLSGGGMAHFELGPNHTSKAVYHRTVEEIWLFLSGRGQMWREHQGISQTVDIYHGICPTIPQETRFQFRSLGREALVAIGVTMPPWPGDEEAVVVSGVWKPTVL